MTGKYPCNVIRLSVKLNYGLTSEDATSERGTRVSTSGEARVGRGAAGKGLDNSPM